MSYILDALRKSESDRQQGRVPDLAQSVQMVHKPKRRAWPVGLWVSLALFFNGAILAVIFWPGSGFLASTVDEQGATQVAEEASAESDQIQTSAAQPATQQQAPEKLGKADTSAPQPSPETKAMMPIVEPVSDEVTLADDVYPEAGSAESQSNEPTLIVPSKQKSGGERAAAAPTYDFADGPPVEHLIEKPLSFQRKIPDLRFSSHIYASDPAARRVMINDNYLSPGDSFSGIRVEAITSDGVVLSAYGETFRVGVVRNWVSPR